jgi:uncharacterized protein (TIGR02271 family)
MKLKWILTNKQVIVSTLGVAAFAVGCSSESTGGSSYASSSAPPYSENTAVGGTAQTQETTSSAQASGSQTIPLYKEQVNVGSQQVNDGAVTIRKVVKTETVNQPVTLTKQTLVIDRQPSQAGAQPSGQAFQDQQITIPLYHDQPVVTTQIVPNGQVVATTRTDSQQTTIQKQVRSEDVAVDKGNAQNVVIQGNMNQQPMGAATEPGGQATGAAAGPITDVVTLTTVTDASSYEGRQAQLTNVKIDQAAGQYLYITDNAGKDLVIHLEQPAENLHPGDTVNISGTVTSLSSQPESMPQAASGQRVYIRAQSVQVAK